MPEYNLQEAYKSILPSYKKLGDNLSQAFELLLEENSIQYLKVYNRIKKADSFMDKVERKSYAKPLEEIEDICGIRIICYYPSDIEKICRIIEREFDVVSSEDKEDLLKPDQFGYRSHHFIIKIKEEWLYTPNYKKLADLKAEVQIRTNLMHTWAEIEHELGYKKEEDIPFKFKRRFSFLSAKLEEADQQFEALKNEINDYRNKKVESKIQPNETINLDSLQMFLDEYFPDRAKGGTSELLSEFKKLKLSISDIKEMYKKCEHLLIELEEEEGEIFEEKIHWAQVGIVRAILSLMIEDYISNKYYPDSLIELTNSYKKRIKK